MYSSDHTSKDKPAIQELAEQLKQDGLRVWFDEWVIQPGDSIPLKDRTGAGAVTDAHSDHKSQKSAFTSEWVTLGTGHTALFRDPTSAERRFIPLRLERALRSQTRSSSLRISRLATERAGGVCKVTRGVPSGSSQDGPIRKPQRQSLAVKVLKGHEARVHSVAITADGRMGHLRLLGSDGTSVGLGSGPVSYHTSIVSHSHVWCSSDSGWGGRRAVSGSSDETGACVGRGDGTGVSSRSRATPTRDICRL